jgi:ABC-type hemin transport system ATPase subunit
LPNPEFLYRRIGTLVLIAMHDLNLAANTARSDDVVTPDMLWAVYRVEANF